MLTAIEPTGTISANHQIVLDDCQSAKKVVCG